MRKTCYAIILGRDSIPQHITYVRCRLARLVSKDHVTDMQNMHFKHPRPGTNLNPCMTCLIAKGSASTLKTIHANTQTLRSLPWTPHPCQEIHQANWQTISTKYTHYRLQKDVARSASHSGYSPRLQGALRAFVESVLGHHLSKHFCISANCE
jgi:hypothetical protein